MVVVQRRHNLTACFSPCHRARSAQMQGLDFTSLAQGIVAVGLLQNDTLCSTEMRLPWTPNDE